MARDHVRTVRAPLLQITARRDLRHVETRLHPLDLLRPVLVDAEDLRRRDRVVEELPDELLVVHAAVLHGALLMGPTVGRDERALLDALELGVVCHGEGLLAVVGHESLSVLAHLLERGFPELADALDAQKITSKQGKEVFAEMLASNKMPSVIIKEKGMETVSDAGAIEAFVDQVIAGNPKAVEDYKGGKTNVVGWLMGQVMKVSGGKANPKEATKLLNEKLSKL